MKNALKLLLSAVIVFMTYTIVTTSKQSNLFYLMNHWGDAGINTYPWFSATLYDFYCNVLILFCWIAYKETSWVSRVLWLVLLVAMGSPATALYVLIQIFKLKKGEGITALLSKQN